MPEAETRQPTNQHPRVVVTGMGMVTPIGSDLSTFWTNLRDGNSGIVDVTHFDASEFRSRIAGEVRDFDPTDYLDAKDAKRTDRFAQLAVAASHDALRHADLTIDDENANDVGVFIQPRPPALGRHCRCAPRSPLICGSRAVPLPPP